MSQARPRMPSNAFCPPRPQVFARRLPIIALKDLAQLGIELPQIPVEKAKLRRLLAMDSVSVCN